MKIASIGFGILALSLAAASNAAPVNYTKNGVAGTFGSLSDTFAGPATLSKTCFGIPITLNCTLTVGGTISQSGSDPDLLDLTITSAASTGSGGGLVTCSDVTFSNFPWTGSAHHDDLPTAPGNLTPTVNFTVGTVNVNTPCGGCSGTVNATYNNTNPAKGKFGFSGSLGTCSVSGNNIVSPTNTYQVWH